MNKNKSFADWFDVVQEIIYEETGMIYNTPSLVQTDYDQGKDPSVVAMDIIYEIFDDDF